MKPATRRCLVFILLPRDQGRIKHLVGLTHFTMPGALRTSVSCLPVNAALRAMLCIRGTSHGPVSVRPSVRLSVRPSQVGVLLKRLNVGSHKQHHTIAQGF